MLTESQADVLTEVMNIGMGYAADALNQMVGTHITFRIPGVAMLSPSAARTHLHNAGWIPTSTILLEFDGSLRGNAALVFPFNSAAKLASVLTGGSPDHIDSERKATLEEVGNILLNGVIGAVTNLLGSQIRLSVPVYSESGGHIEGLASSSDEDARVILAYAHFDAAVHQIEGEILLYFEMQSVAGLLAAVDSTLLTSWN